MVSPTQPCFGRILGNAGRHHIPCCYVRNYCGPRCCVNPRLWERSASHWWPFRPCHQTAGPGHPAAHSPGSARQVEVPVGVLRPRHQSQELLVSSAQALRQEVESPNQTSQSPSKKKTTSAQRRLHKPSTGSSLSVLPSLSRFRQGDKRMYCGEGWKEPFAAQLLYALAYRLP